MDPIQQIFAQIGAATARGEGMGQYFMQGRQLAQQDERIDLERQSLDLRERLALSDEVMKRFDYEEKVRMVDERVNNAAALSMLADYMGKAISSGTAADPSSAQPIWDIVSKNPLVVGDDRFKEMWSKYTAAATLQQARTQFEAQHGPEGSRQRIAELKAAADLTRARVTTEGAMDRTIEQREGAYERELLRATRPSGATNVRTPGGVTAELVDMARAKNDEADAIEAFDEAGAERLRFDAAQLLRQPSAIQQSNQIKALADKEASGVPLTPGEAAQLGRLKRPTTEVYSENLITGQPETKRVEGRVIQPVDLKDRIVGLRKNTDVLGLIENMELTSATDYVGTKPKILKLVKDQILPQLGFNTASPDRAVAQSELTRFTQQGIRALNAEARLSNQDATMLMAAFPDVDGWLESPARAEAMLQAFKRATALGAVRDAKAAHRGVPPIAGKALFAEDWFRAYEQGSLTYDEAVALTRHYKSPRRTP